MKMATIAMKSSTSSSSSPIRGVSIVVDQQPQQNAKKNASITSTLSLSSSPYSWGSSSSSSSNTFSSTLIDISGNSNSVATISCGIPTNANSNTTFPQTTTTSQESTVTNTSNPDNNGERRRESKEISLASSSSSLSAMITATDGNGNNISDSISISPNGANDDQNDDFATNTSTTVILQCNGRCGGDDDSDAVDRNCIGKSIGIISSSSSSSSSSTSVAEKQKQQQQQKSTVVSSSTSTTNSDVHQQNGFVSQVSRVPTDCDAATQSATLSFPAVKDFHILKIQISPNDTVAKVEKNNLIIKKENQLPDQVNIKLKELNIETKSKFQKVSIENSENVDKPLVTVVNLGIGGQIGGIGAVEECVVSRIINENEQNSRLQSKNIAIDDEKFIKKMVQKPQNGSSANNNLVISNNNNQNQSDNSASNNTSVTELNVSNPSYLYFMMTSGQFSPCDSGTCSDMDTNSNGTAASTTPPPPPPSNQLQQKLLSNVGNGTTGAGSKLEMHLKTIKNRMNNCSSDAVGGNNSKRINSSNSSNSSNNNKNDDHQRAGSLTDSEESESSLSCDSLISSEFLNSGVDIGNKSRTTTKSSSTTANLSKKNRNNKISSFLPDSLLRDIRDRSKFVTCNDDDDDDNDDDDDDDDDNDDFERKYSNPLFETEIESMNGNDYDDVDIDLQSSNHNKYVNERNNSNLFENSKNNRKLNGQQPNKTFVLNLKDGTFVDTKMNSMPRTYEADKFYNFHVNEHENYRSFGNSSTFCSETNGSGSSLTDCETRNSSLHDDAFAGYRDISSGGNSATSTIRSSKGTVRGVKNRVRNGIATFLQLQQANVKNYKEKDLGKVVLYTTSMGIIRDTYAKCSNMKQILRTLLVKFEERDVFMSMEYQQEIKERMHSEEIKVPQLFVEGQHIGDAEQVERLNESGELRQLLKPYKSIATTYTCQTCGGYRLLPCPSCNGSKKSVHRNHFTAEFVALKCMNCDEVGLVKCHNC